MKKIAVITTSKELKEFQERTDIRILDINVKACEQTWATQEYFVATIVYDEDLRSASDYWTRLEHQYAGMAMQGMMAHTNIDYDEIVDLCVEFAHTLVEKLKNE